MYLLAWWYVLGQNQRAFNVPCNTIGSVGGMFLDFLRFRLCKVRSESLLGFYKYRYVKPTHYPSLQGYGKKVAHWYEDLCGVRLTSYSWDNSIELTESLSRYWDEWSFSNELGAAEEDSSWRWELEIEERKSWKTVVRVRPIPFQTR